MDMDDVLEHPLPDAAAPELSSEPSPDDRDAIARAEARGPEHEMNPDSRAVLEFFMSTSRVSPVPPCHAPSGKLSCSSTIAPPRMPFGCYFRSSVSSHVLQEKRLILKYLARTGGASAFFASLFSLHGRYAPCSQSLGCWVTISLLQPPKPAVYGPSYYLLSTLWAL